jgi:lipoyl(octanoyl) transferase
VIIRDLGQTDYHATWAAMRALTSSREPDSPDQLWLTEHMPVFTLGQAGDPGHVLAAGEIPLVRSDRGGQVTYHGPGQIVVYVLFDLARKRLGVRALVRLLEDAVVGLLARHGVTAEGRVDAPGVYVGAAKIASIGLRVRHGRTYHGLAFNADMDLEPFGRINPCGYRGLAVTDARRLGIADTVAVLKQQLVGEIGVRWEVAPARPLESAASSPAVPRPTVQP